VTSSCSERWTPTARILWLAKGLGRGGAERLLVSLAKRLDRSFFELEVAYVLPWKDALVPELEQLGVPVHCLGGSGAFDMRWLPRLRRLVRRRRFDLVHTHTPSVAVGARTLRRPPIVHTEHNTWERYRALTRWGNRLTYPRNAAVIAVSDAVARSIRPAPFARTWPPVHVIHHGAELSACQPTTPETRARARTALGVREDAVVIGNVGNFTPKKDHRTLLEAMALATSKNHEIQLVLVGSGPHEGAVRDDVRSLELNDRVLFAGSRDDVAALLPAFDVFALSSRYEGLPIALLEAMATGVPCVATSVGGVPEVVDNGNEGLLVPAGDSSAMADALLTLVRAPHQRTAMGARAALTASQFDVAEAARSSEAVYRLALWPSPRVIVPR
jgi:glycosyltransferase involved in cell wall biosynthesis